MFIMKSKKEREKRDKREEFISLCKLQKEREANAPLDEEGYPKYPIEYWDTFRETGIHAGTLPLTHTEYEKIVSSFKKKK